MERDEKECPFCAEIIKAKAILCKHCHSDLRGAPKAQPESAASSEDSGPALVQLDSSSFVPDTDEPAIPDQDDFPPQDPARQGRAGKSSPSRLAPFSDEPPFAKPAAVSSTGKGEGTDRPAPESGEERHPLPPEHGEGRGGGYAPLPAPSAANAGAAIGYYTMRYEGADGSASAAAAREIGRAHV